jgi:hypothetical protein
MGERRRWARAASGWVLLVCGALAGSAHADGAFPDSGQVLVPADQPQVIIGGTATFGFIITTDGGTTWSWMCAAGIGAGAALYTVGASPTDALYSVLTSADSVAVSRDMGHTWHSSPVQFALNDAFPDPNMPGHVLAVGSLRQTDPKTPAARAMWESADYLQTVGAPLYTSPPGANLNGVEISRSDANWIYITMSVLSPDIVPYIVRSNDGGKTFQEFSQEQTFKGQTLFLAAVDRTNPQRLYVRAKNNGSDALAISNDGGQTLQVALQLTESMSAFLERADGTLIVGTRMSGAFISHDGGASFSQLPGAPHLHGLGEREEPIPGGTGTRRVLYAYANDQVDGYAVGRSVDDGATWQGLVSYGHVCQTLDDALCLDHIHDAGGFEGVLDLCTDPGSGGQAGGPQPPVAKSGCSLAASVRGGEAANWPIGLACAVAGALVWRRRRRAGRGARAASARAPRAPDAP